MCSEWLDIETAPKERTPILLGRIGKPTMSGRYYKEATPPGFYSDNIGADEITPADPATHWMPLPTPPEGS